MTASQEAPNRDGHFSTPSLAGQDLPTAELPDVPISNGAAPLINGHSNGYGSDDPFQLSSKYAYMPRKIRVVTIGAGFSGLIMAHKFQHRFPALRDIVKHTIFEARSDVGGTWLANHYPGVQCDVPAHIYVSNLPVATLVANPVSD